MIIIYSRFTTNYPSILFNMILFVYRDCVCVILLWIMTPKVDDSLKANLWINCKKDNQCVLSWKKWSQMTVQKYALSSLKFPWQQESTIPKERDQTLETPEEDMCSVWYVEVQLCCWKCSESRLLICETDLI